MTAPPTSLPTTVQEPSLTQRFALIIDDLCRVAAARAGRDRSASATVLVLWTYLRRLAIRFERLVARFHAGRLASRPARPAPHRSQPGTAPPRRRLPTGFGWLRRLVPETTGYGSQLRYLLDDPLMADLLAATPQAGRLLRPLCRMLGHAPDELPPALRPPRRDRPPTDMHAPRSRPPEPAASASALPPKPLAALAEKC